MLPHEILGVSDHASAAEIKAAWKKKAFAHHPDRGGDPEDFKRAFRAYETLKNNPQRARSRSADNAATNEQPQDLDRYADAYYDAWLNVPSDLRFWLNTFETIHAGVLPKI